MENDYIKGNPFLKWVGSKRQLAPFLAENIPNKNRLVEPFVGSGAVFMATNFKEYVLSDINPDLIYLYQIIKDDCENFIDHASQLFKGVVDKVDYYNNRDKFNQSTDKFERACLFLYLNKHCFNGVCRYNSKGGFNVPIGTLTSKPCFPFKEVRLFARKLNECKTTLIVQSFEDTMDMCKRSDVVYCDPPYYPLSPSENFVNYHTKGFSLYEHEILAKKAKNLSLSGTPVVISNNPTAISLYKGAKITDVNVSRFVGGKNAKRGKTGEIIAIFNTSDSCDNTIKKEKFQHIDESVVNCLKGYKSGVTIKYLSLIMDENKKAISDSVKSLKKKKVVFNKGHLIFLSEMVAQKKLPCFILNTKKPKEVKAMSKDNIKKDNHLKTNSSQKCDVNDVNDVMDILNNRVNDYSDREVICLAIGEIKKLKALLKIKNDTLCDLFNNYDFTQNEIDVKLEAAINARSDI